MHKTEYKRILSNYDSKLEAILDIANMDLPEQNEIPEWNRF